MSRKERKHAETIIVESIEKLYPDLKVRPTTGNYILNQLLKAGYTNDKISSTPEEVKEDLSQAAFACKTSDAEDFAKLIPQSIVLSNKDFDTLALALAEPPAPNPKLMELFRLHQEDKFKHIVIPGLSDKDNTIIQGAIEASLKADQALLVAGPRPEQRVLITNIRPEIHFYGSGSKASPCGNDDDNAPVTHHEFEVTCKGCKEWLRKHRL